MRIPYKKLISGCKECYKNKLYEEEIVDLDVLKDIEPRKSIILELMKLFKYYGLKWENASDMRGYERFSDVIDMTSQVAINCIHCDGKSYVAIGMGVLRSKKGKKLTGKDFGKIWRKEYEIQK